MLVLSFSPDIPIAGTFFDISFSKPFLLIRVAELIVELHVTSLLLVLFIPTIVEITLISPYQKNQ